MCLARHSLKAVRPRYKLAPPACHRDAEFVRISRRSDGTYTYRRQWISVARTTDTDSSIINANNDPKEAWGPLGPDCGIYDSAGTAESEARHRVPWLLDFS